MPSFSNFGNKVNVHIEKNKKNIEKNIIRNKYIMELVTKIVVSAAPRKHCSSQYDKEQHLRIWIPCNSAWGWHYLARINLASEEYILVVLTQFFVTMLSTRQAKQSYLLVGAAFKNGQFPDIIVVCSFAISKRMMWLWPRFHFYTKIPGCRAILELT